MTTCNCNEAPRSHNPDEVPSCLAPRFICPFCKSPAFEWKYESAYISYVGEVDDPVSLCCGERLVMANNPLEQVTEAEANDEARIMQQQQEEGPRE